MASGATHWTRLAMHIYLAGERAATESVEQRKGEGQAGALWVQHVKRRLFSFFYHGFSGGTTSSMMDYASGLTEEISHAHKLGQALFLDSGAFTAFTKKAKIDIKEYADYVTQHRDTYAVCSSLDAIGRGEEAARESYDNFTRLKSLGAQVQPVFHIREPDHWLQRYIDEGHDYIFIGGMVPETTQWLMVRLDRLFADILCKPDGTPKVKLHGFGLTDSKLMFRYPWYSVDSTSWLMTGIFGACMFRVNGKLRKVVFSDESPTARKWKGWHYKNLPAQSKEKVDQWIAPYGVTAEQLASHYSYRDVVNAAVFQGLEDLGAQTFHEKQMVLF